MKDKEKNNAVSNQFVNLSELLYTPLQAVAQSNMKLGTSVMDLIASTGDISPTDAENTVHLKTINLAYEQINNDSVSGKVIEEIGLRVPMISLMPISNLQIKKSKIAFDVEIKKIRKNKKTNHYDLESRICSSSKHSRKDGLPRLSFEMELESAPISEGLARFIDVLNVNPIPETLSSHHVDDNGEIITGEKAAFFQEMKELKIKEARLNVTGEKLTGLIAKKKLMFDEMLKECGQNGSFDTMFIGDETQKMSALNTMTEGYERAEQMKKLYSEINDAMNIYQKLMDKAVRFEEKRIQMELEHIRKEISDEE